MLGRIEGQQEYQRRERDGAGQVRPSVTGTHSSGCRSEASSELFRCVGLQIVGQANLLEARITCDLGTKEEESYSIEWYT